MKPRDLVPQRFVKCRIGHGQIGGHVVPNVSHEGGNLGPSLLLQANTEQLRPLEHLSGDQLLFTRTHVIGSRAKHLPSGLAAIGKFQEHQILQGVPPSGILKGLCN